MTTPLDDAKRTEYTALTEAMSILEIIADPEKNAQQVAARLDAIKALLTPDMVMQFICERQKQVVHALHCQPADPIRYIVLISPRCHRYCVDCWVMPARSQWR